MKPREVAELTFVFAPNARCKPFQEEVVFDAGGGWGFGEGE
jgi:hypothetical protein